jgi:hypothetical protein
MTAFLFVTVCVALLAGLVGLVAGHVPWTAGLGRPRALPWGPSDQGLTNAAEPEQAWSCAQKGGDLWGNDRAANGPLGRPGTRRKGDWLAWAVSRSGIRCIHPHQQGGTTMTKSVRRLP